MISRKKLLATIIPILLVATLFYFFSQMMDIGFHTDIPPIGDKNQVSKKDKTILYIGVVSRFSPSLLYKGYQPLIDYLNKQTDYHFELRLNKSYEESVKQLAEGKLQAAFLGTYVFNSKMDDYPLHAFLAPLNKERKPLFQTVLLMREDTPYHSFVDLSGKKIGVPSRLSFSGNWLQEYVLPNLYSKNMPLPEFIHYDFHHTVVQHVIRGNLDGGVVKDRVADEYTGKGLRIVEKSDPIPASPLVSGPGSSEEVITAIESVLVNIKNKKLSELNSWDPEFKNGFILVNNGLYREFKNRSKKNREK